MKWLLCDITDYRLPITDYRLPVTMKILVYGVGAVGGYIAGKLQQGGHEVTAVARQVTAEAIDANGLVIVEEGKRFRTNPKTVTAIAPAFLDEQVYDLIILGMKAYDLEAALDPLVAFCPAPPTIITLQNGIGVEQYAVNLFGEENVISGALTIPLTRETTSQIRVEQPGHGLVLAPIHNKKRIKEWVDLFKSVGINTKGVRDYQSMQWSRALLNMMGNASSAIVNRPPDILYKSDTMFDLDVRMLQEALAVMKKLKIKVMDLPGGPASQLANGVSRPKIFFKRFLVNTVTTGRGDKMPSFYSDISAGKRKNEVAYHNGAVARAGESVGIYTPVNKAYNDVLLMLSYKRLDWQEYDGRPQKLFADVKRVAEQMKQQRADNR
jgi:2-dehydropantoate 2-reductase